MTKLEEIEARLQALYFGVRNLDVTVIRKDIRWLLDEVKRLETVLNVALKPFEFGVAALKKSPDGWQKYFTLEFMEKVVEHCRGKALAEAKEDK